MTDLEMLDKCLSAFRSMGTAYYAKRFLKKKCEPHKAYAGSGTEQLRRHMIDELEQHFESGKNSL